MTQEEYSNSSEIAESFGSFSDYDPFQLIPALESIGYFHLACSIRCKGTIITHSYQHCETRDITTIDVFLDKRLENVIFEREGIRSLE